MFLYENIHPLEFIRVWALKLDEPDNIKVSEILRYFEKRLPNMHCAACGGADFEVEVNEAEHYAEWPSGNPNLMYGESENFWPVVIVSCKACGFFMPFSHAFIARWVAANPGDEGSA